MSIQKANMELEIWQMYVFCTCYFSKGVVFRFQLLVFRGVSSDIVSMSDDHGQLKFDQPK